MINATHHIIRSCAYAILSLALGVGTEALAQQQSPRLQPVDEGVADVNDLSVSLRRPGVELFVPNNFERIYSAPDGEFVRIRGALHAYFPHSVYEQAGGVNIPLIPPGTVFSIGPRQNPARQNDAINETSPQEFPNRRNTRIDMRLDQTETAAASRTESTELQSDSPRIMSDPIYRRQRLRTLLRRAARARQTQ